MLREGVLIVQDRKLDGFILYLLKSFYYILLIK